MGENALSTARVISILNRLANYGQQEKPEIYAKRGLLSMRQLKVNSC